MSSGFPGGVPEFYSAASGGIATGRSANMIPMNTSNTPSQVPYRPPLSAGINLPDPASQILQHQQQLRSDFVRKRSLAEFQQQQAQLLLLQQRQQQQYGLSAFLRNVKQRTGNAYQQHASPISPLSPVDFSGLSQDQAVSSTSSISTNSSPMNARYGHPVLPQVRQQQTFSLGNSMLSSSSSQSGNNTNVSASISYSNLVQNRGDVNTRPLGPLVQDSEKKMMNQLLELEKHLLDDNEEDVTCDAMSVVTNSEWSETIQNLIGPTQKPVPSSPASSSSSCSSSSASPPVTCPKQSVVDAASAISEGNTGSAVEILTRLGQVSNAKGTSEQRLTAYMASALRSRVNPAEYPPPVNELYTREHAASTQMLYEVSPCFKLGFMAANLAILEAISELQHVNKLHVIDFDIAQVGQYMHLLHALAAKKAERPIVLKITTFADFVSGGEERLKMVGDGLRALASKIGVGLSFNVSSLKVCDLSRESLGVESDEALAVNFAFRLYKLPDESVTTENLRDELLRRVKGLSPTVVTVVEQEMNANTAAFGTRVNEAWGYYGALFESLEATVGRESPERVRIEEGLGRKMGNSVACEGRDRVERCEVLGKWRARMSMAGFESRGMSQLVAESLRSKLNSGTRGNPGFTVNEQTGGICFGWKERTLTVASAWR